MVYFGIKTDIAYRSKELLEKRIIQDLFLPTTVTSRFVVLFSDHGYVTGFIRSGHVCIYGLKKNEIII